MEELFACTSLISEELEFFAWKWKLMPELCFECSTEFDSWIGKKKRSIPYMAPLELNLLILEQSIVEL